MGINKISNKESAVLERRFVPAGTVVVREGEEANCAYLIQSGKVRIFAGQGGKRVELATLGAGQIFGEMALLADDERTASAEALEDTGLILITRKMLADKLEKSDSTIRALVPMLMKRIMHTNISLLKRQSDMNELVETVNSIYHNIHASLPAAQKQSLENSVLPKLEELMGAIKTFTERYALDEIEEKND